jgi:hypothetical protein
MLKEQDNKGVNARSLNEKRKHIVWLCLKWYMFELAGAIGYKIEYRKFHP